VRLGWRRPAFYSSEYQVSAEIPFSIGWLSAYLSHKWGGRIPIEIVERVQFPRGSSRETWFVKIRNLNRSEDIQSLVFRMDYPEGSTIPTSILQEYQTYALLAKTSVPIAKPLWFEDDPTWTESERPFYVREHVDGNWSIPGFNDPAEGLDELRIDISKEHMRKLAIVHNVDWKALGFDQFLAVPLRLDACAQTMIEAADFAFMQNFAPEIERRGKNVWGLEKALAFYEQVSGIHVEVSSVRYYFNLRSLATLVFSHNAARAVSQSDAAQIRQAWTGTEIVYIAKRLLGAAMSLAAPLAPSRYDDLNESLV